MASHEFDLSIHESAQLIGSPSSVTEGVAQSRYVDDEMTCIEVSLSIGDQRCELRGDIFQLRTMLESMTRGAELAHANRDRALEVRKARAH